MTEKEKKDKYLHTCLKCRRSFTCMVYSVDGIPRTEAVASHPNLALLLSNNLKREYLEICGFVRAWISLAIVISNTLLLCDARDKEAYIPQRLNIEDVSVMAQLAPWRG